MVILILFSPILLLVPKWELPLSLASSTSLQLNAWSLPTLLLSYWIVGSTLTLTFYIIQAVQLSQWVHRTESIDSGYLFNELELATQQSNLKRSPSLHISSEAHSPVVTGLFHPTIILPQYATNWDRSTLHMVYIHELGHIQRKDLWLSLAAQLNCVLYWWNPLVWMLKNSLRYQCEFAVDASVIAKGTDSKSYISALCNVAEEMLKHRPLLSSTLSMTYQATLRKRVNSLIKRQRSLHPFTFTSLTLLCISSVIAIATTKPINSAQTNLSPLDEVQLRLSASPFPADR
ncbi:M56 family metallopeptidase [Rubritalea spongiae]|uniref:M56 family metallopeptidase n=1 Tax=Rubritalea spongiae TaxID=430797 RepID=A0ABW5E4P7_9BACT